jgi:hypothetical protein
VRLVAQRRWRSDRFRGDVDDVHVWRASQRAVVTEVVAFSSRRVRPCVRTLSGGFAAVVLVCENVGMRGACREARMVCGVVSQ